MIMWRYGVNWLALTYMNVKHSKEIKDKFLIFWSTLCVDDGKELYFEFESKVLLWYFHLNKVALKIVLGSDFKI